MSDADLGLVIDRKDGQNTFSRFVMPFACKRHPFPDPQLEDVVFVEQYRADFYDRRKYFTRETGKVLYDKAKWFELKGFDGPWARGVPVSLNGGSFIAVMPPPKLVVFEWGNKRSKIDVLRSGFLVVDVCLRAAPLGRAPQLDDLLDFNEVFRYTNRPWRGHYSEVLYPMFGHRRNSFLHEYAGKEEDAGGYYLNAWCELLRLPVKVAGEYYRLVSDESVRCAKDYQCGCNASEEKQAAGFLIYQDERAYVWSAAVLQQSAGALCLLDKECVKTEPWRFGHWVKLLNVDQSGGSPENSHQTSLFERDWARDRTYMRWAHWGTYYGFTYHSGSMLCGPPPDKPEIVNHFKTLYFDIALLLFYIRVSLFRFSDELCACARDGEIDQKRYSQRFEDIREQFAYFTIRYQFPILSNQQQAIEMYDLMRRQFDIDDFFQEVKNEIHETYEYLDMKQNRDLADDANKLASVGIPLAVGGLVGAVLSSAAINELHLVGCLRDGNCAINQEAFVLGGAVIGATLIYPLWRWLKYLKQKMSERNSHD